MRSLRGKVGAAHFRHHCANRGSQKPEKRRQDLEKLVKQNEGAEKSLKEQIEKKVAAVALEQERPAHFQEKLATEKEVWAANRKLLEEAKVEVEEAPQPKKVLVITNSWAEIFTDDFTASIQGLSTADRAEAIAKAHAEADR